MGFDTHCYDYQMIFMPEKEQVNAGVLSLLPLPQSPVEAHQPAELVLLTETLQTTPVTAAKIKGWT